jgi:RNA polymerase primary sigma factor
MRKIKLKDNGLMITNPNDKDNFYRYLADISKFKPLSREEEIETFKLIKLGDESAIDKISKHNLLFVVSVAKLYSPFIKNSSLTLEDLINEGNFGLIKAAHRFDYTTGNKFISYAVWWIKQRILDSIQTNVKSVRVPPNVRGIWNNINKKEAKLEQLLSRSPTTIEIFEAMLEDDNSCFTEKDSYKKIDRIISANNFESSIDSFVGDDESTQMNQLIKSDDANPEDLLITKERKQFIVALLDRAPLSIREQIKDYYGIDGRDRLTYRELGEKYGQKPATIKDHIERCFRKIRRTTNSKQYFYPSSSYLQYHPKQVKSVSYEDEKIYFGK